MKYTYLPVIVLSLLASRGAAQYCMLNGQTPYSSLQPGITNFSLNTINRTSSNSESASAVVVTTGLSTTLTAGQVYTVSISHSEDGQFFPGARNNLRIWADLNNNFSFTDPGETLLSVDLRPPNSTYTGTIMIPATAAGGTVYLRATAKMSADAGHTLPTPCNTPADPLGYHGEMEDYTIYVQPAAPEPALASFALTSTLCIAKSATVTNGSTGTPTPTFSWSAIPSSGVTYTPASTAATPTIHFSVPGTYSVFCQATNSSGSNTSVRTVTVSACDTRVSGINEAPFAVFPNPACGTLNIRTNGHSEFHITDGSGRQVKQVLCSEAELTVDISDFAPGIYFVSGWTGQRMTVVKLAVQ